MGKQVRKLDLTPVGETEIDKPVSDKPVKKLQLEPYEEPVKKKESTSPSGSGLEKQPAQPSKPSEQSSENVQVSLTKEQQASFGKSQKQFEASLTEQGREDQNREQILQKQKNAKKEVSDPFTALEKSISSTFADQIPKEYYVQRLRMSKGNFADLFDRRSNLNQFGDKLPENLSRWEYNQWKGKNLESNRGLTQDDIARKFLVHKLGEDGFEKFRKSFEDENVKQRLEFEDEIQQQNAEAAEKRKGLVEDYEEIDGANSLLNYVSNMVGQTAARVPTSVGTGGFMSIVSESSEVFDRQVDLIAKDKGLTRKEVVDQGLDKPGDGQVLATLLGGLDALSAVNVLSLFKSAAKGQVKKTLLKEIVEKAGKSSASGVVEGLTEAVQTEGEELAASQGAEVEYDPELNRMLNSFLGGFVGGTIFSAVTPEATTDAAIETVNVTDPTSVETAAQEIQESIDENIGKYDFSESSIKRDNIPPAIQDQPISTNQPQSYGRTEESTGPESGSIAFGTATDVSRDGEISGQPQAGTIPPSTDESGNVQGGGPNLSPDDRVGGDENAEVQSEAIANEGTKQTALGERVESSKEPTEIKESVSGRDKYIPRQVIKTNEEAKKILTDWNDTEFAERAIRDTSNSMPGGTRGALAANLYEDYKKKAEASENTDEKASLYNKAADIAVWAAQNLTKSGQETAIAGKIWKSIMSNEDLMVTALEKQNAAQQAKVLAPIREDVQMSKSQIEAEIRKQVTAGVEANLARAKAITPERKKKINDFFESIKVKDVGGTANDITRVLGATVWNSSVEVVKRAVLAGADIANAIQAGLDYVRENHKGEFNEDEFRAALEPGVTQMVEQTKADASKIDESKINTPKISGRKKKEFIQEVVDAYNKGKLTEEKFDELYAKRTGFKPYSESDRMKIRELAKIVAEVEKSIEETKNNFTKENISKHQEVLKKAQKANQELQKYAQREPSNVWDTLGTIMQGNLLTPLSIITNVYSNTVYQPLRFVSALVATPMDRMLIALAKAGVLSESYKKPAVDLVAAQKGYFDGGWNGAMEGLYQLTTGSLVDERSLTEISSKFDPVRAWGRIKEGDQSTAQKVNDYIEGTFGIPAEAMFRMLNLGDKPFRRAAEMARASEIADQMKLTGTERLKFLMFPDEENAKIIDDAGKQATFQNDTAASKLVQRGVNALLEAIGSVPVVGGPAKLIARAQVPFVKTPVNILVETANYAIPIASIPVGIFQVAKGNKRTGLQLISKGLVGLMIWQVSKWLLDAGLMTQGDDKEKDGKVAERRSIMFDGPHANSINVSGIQRMLRGEDPSPRDNDTWVDYKKMGITGIVMQNYANQWYQATRDGEVPFDDFLKSMSIGSIQTMSSGLDQTFLAGTNNLLNAIKNPDGQDGDRWVVGTTEALSSIVLPNTISNVSKASDQYIRDTKDDKLVEKLRNVYKTKVFAGESLPARVNLWGEKVTGNPEGRDKYAYYLFDPTKFKQVDTDNFKYKVYSKWKDSGFDDDWLPSMPQRRITVKGVQIPLTSKEYELYATLVGSERADLTAEYMSRQNVQLEKLKKRYEKGAERGKKKFLMDMGWNVTTKEALEKLSADRKK
jgi:hypothetical protein